MKLHDKTESFDGYKIQITIHHDEHMGPPWEEHDGHGIVSGWERRDKQPGERVLHSDRNSARFYDFAGSLVIAKGDGWGLGDEDKAKLAAKLGRKPTAKEILVQAVEQDFDYLRRWCNDDWQWLGYTTEIETPDGKTIDGDSCWGFDEEKYMLSEALSHARHTIEQHQLTERETAIAECIP